MFAASATVAWLLEGAAQQQAASQIERAQKATQWPVATWLMAEVEEISRVAAAKVQRRRRRNACHHRDECRRTELN